MTTMSSQGELVLTEIINNKGVLTLNRPKSLNAFNLTMVEIIISRLKEWDNQVQCVILKGNGGRAFCAGGDVVSITNLGPENYKIGINIIRREYTMAFAIGHCKVPVVAIIDGITMGGGAGMAANAKYRIATERTLFSMPETAIGIFPDMSGSYFLPRLRGKLGLYLGLTCQRLKGKDVVKIGFGTHFVDSKDLPNLYEALIKENDIEKAINQYAQDISNHTFCLDSKMDIINKAFSAPTVEEIIRRLESEGSDFSLDTIKTIRKMSPYALKVCKVQLEKGSKMNLKECLQMEFRIANSVLGATFSQDFYEGVRALLKEKDHNPKWNPALLEEVSDQIVERAFLPIRSEEELTCKL